MTPPALPFPARVLSTLATASLGILREDPREFAYKVSERIRLANIPAISRSITKLPISTQHTNHQRTLIKQGKLTSAATFPNGSRLVATRARQTLEQIQAPIAPGAPITPSNTPKPLFFLNNSLPYTHSGYTERTHNLLKALKAQGINLHAVTRLGYPVVIGKFPRTHIDAIDGIAYQRLIPTRYPRTLHHRDRLTVDELVRLAREHNATILHTTTEYKNAIVVSQAAERLGIPWIYEVRGEPESTWLSRFPTNEQPAAKQSEFYQLSHHQETNAMKSASAVIALSEVSKRSMISRGVSADKIHVIPNAVDESLIGIDYNQNDIRRELGLPSGPIVGTITSVVGYEGLHDLIRALKFLPDVTCLIVGDGTARPGLEMLADEHCLTNRVIFAGRQPSETIWKWYAALDVFVMPRKDTEVTRVVTPIKGLIAQGLGKNIVASDLPALREVTGDLATYFPAGNAGALADALRKALTTHQPGHQDWARTRTWNANGDRVAAIYRAQNSLGRK